MKLRRKIVFICEKVRRRFDIVRVEQEGFKYFSVWCTGGGQMAVMCERKDVTDEREVDYHRVGRIRSEFAAGWKMKGVIFDKKEYRCKGI